MHPQCVMKCKAVAVRSSRPSHRFRRDAAAVRQWRRGEPCAQPSGKHAWAALAPLSASHHAGQFVAVPGHWQLCCGVSAAPPCGALSEQLRVLCMPDCAEATGGLLLAHLIALFCMQTCFVRSEYHSDFGSFPDAASKQQGAGNDGPAITVFTCLAPASKPFAPKPCALYRRCSLKKEGGNDECTIMVVCASVQLPQWSS